MTSRIAFAGFSGTATETSATAVVGRVVGRVVAAWLAARRARAVRCVERHLARRGFSLEEIAAIRAGRPPIRSN